MTEGKISWSSENGVITMQWIGRIDEATVFPNINFDSISKLSIDMDKVISINSSGLKNWLIWLRAIPNQVQINYALCPPVIVGQMQTVVGLLPTNVKILSFYVPYFCRSCNKITTRLVSPQENVGLLTSLIHDKAVCVICKKEVLLDTNKDDYMKILLRLFQY